MLKEYTPQSLKQALENEGMEVSPLGRGNLKGVAFEDGGGYRISWEGDRYLQYHHRKGSHHKDAYYKISGGKKEKGILG